MAKRKETVSTDVRGDKLEITPLGAGNEVGRSSVFMTFKGKNILFDCGIHPAYSGLAALPFFDEIDLSTVDILLVTHFHLDHAASLPYVTEKTAFKGKVYMTHATKAIYKLLLLDFVRVSKVAVEDMLYDEHDLERSMAKIEVIDYHQTVEVDGIRFWAYTAGHVLGAAMFMVDVAGVRVLYTGDYSREEDRHLRAAEMPPFSPDVCIIESTYGVQIHQPRAVRERRFTEIIASTVMQGGRVLIPAFALGRAQELLLIMEEYWAAHPEIQHVPIYYASPLAQKSLLVYQTYINSMNDRIRGQFEIDNPFNFKFISNLRSIREFEDVGPSVVMASPGMLQSGMSRQLFDMWCQDKRNACIVPGYSVEGTLASTILKEPKEVVLQSGLPVPLRMSVHYISFSAHADYTQTSDFLTELRPPNIILVHGEANEMGRLKSKLNTVFAGTDIKVLTPKNTQTVELHFTSEKTAKTVGRLAAETPGEGTQVGGLLVKKGFTYQLMDPADLHTYTQLSSGSVLQRQSLPYRGSFFSLRQRLEQLYEGVVTVDKAEVESLSVHGVVTVRHESDELLVMEWASDPIADMVADSVVALVLQLDAGASEKRLALVGTGSVSERDELRLRRRLLRDLFGTVDLDEEAKVLTVKMDGVQAKFDYESKELECEDEQMADRIRTAFRRMDAAVHPLKV